MKGGLAGEADAFTVFQVKGIPKEAAKELGIACIDLRLAQQEVGDLTGLPRRDCKHTVWSRPEWWP